MIAIIIKGPAYCSKPYYEIQGHHDDFVTARVSQYDVFAYYLVHIFIQSLWAQGGLSI